MTTTSKARRARRRKAQATTTTAAPSQGRTRPDPKLISWQDYWADFNNRLSIHNYEIEEVMSDLRSCVAFTTETYKEYKQKFDNLHIGEE